jgi:tetratricopeptide (TPR) repeat protein
LGDFAGSLEDFGKVLELSPESGWTWYGRGCVLHAAGRLKEALEDFRKALEFLPKEADYPRLRIWLARSRLGERPAAEAEFKAYLASRPEAGRNDWFGQCASFLVGDASEADLLGAMGKSDPPGRKWREFEGRFVLGMKSLLEGDAAKARGHLEKCLAAGERNFFIILTAKGELAALR